MWPTDEVSEKVTIPRLMLIGLERGPDTGNYSQVQQVSPMLRQEGNPHGRQFWGWGISSGARHSKGDVSVQSHCAPEQPSSPWPPGSCFSQTEMRAVPKSWPTVPAGPGGTGPGEASAAPVSGPWESVAGAPAR